MINIFKYAWWQMSMFVKKAGNLNFGRSRCYLAIGWLSLGCEMWISRQLVGVD